MERRGLLKAVLLASCLLVVCSGRVPTVIHQPSTTIYNSTLAGHRQEGRLLLRLPFRMAEVSVQGQDKVYKDVIEPLESVSINMIPTTKEDIRDLGPPDPATREWTSRLPCTTPMTSLTTSAMRCCAAVQPRSTAVAALLASYEEVKAKGSENFDRELEDMIDRLIVECERKIQGVLKRLTDEDAKAAIAISVSEVPQSEEVAQLSKEIKEKMKEADIFDFEGIEAQPLYQTCKMLV
ncbi:uncharacterized protein LOC125537679 [Triticum urartu]|uniref:uncharacterized protein LOC125537679 n=1 Tax=Triticum urartu TaxID=4572 RepID=UPI0020439A65|nr:uncharacterized protein LOC125537679 [Triticum urartu]XP_048556958.1 uncharacterized protein LOC125537679 [Triticum urartu]